MAVQIPETIKLIAELKQQNQWISADNPPKNTHVKIGWEKDWGISLIYFNNGRWNYAHDLARRGSEDILYYMPLPLPTIDTDKASMPDNIE